MTDYDWYIGRRVDSGSLVYGDLIHDYYKMGDTCIGHFRKDAGVFEVDPDTVGRCTGERAADNTFLYEGEVAREADVVHDGKVQIPGRVFKIAMRKGCWVGLTENDWEFLHSIAKDLTVIAEPGELEDSDGIRR